MFLIKISKNQQQNCFPIVVLYTRDPSCEVNVIPCLAGTKNACPGRKSNFIPSLLKITPDPSTMNTVLAVGIAEHSLKAVHFNFCCAIPFF